MHFAIVMANAISFLQWEPQVGVQTSNAMCGRAPFVDLCSLDRKKMLERHANLHLTILVFINLLEKILDYGTFKGTNRRSEGYSETA